MVFSFFKKDKRKNKTEICAPINGEIVRLADVPDPVFSEKMMGEGIAIDPTDGQVYSPVNGEIIQVFPTKHAIGILAQDGSQILIHIGLDTVHLKGEGFTVHVTKGQVVTKSDLLIDFDLDYIKENAPSAVTPIVITNSQTSD